MLRDDGEPLDGHDNAVRCVLGRRDVHHESVDVVLVHLRRADDALPVDRRLRDRVLRLKPVQFRSVLHATVELRQQLLGLYRMLTPTVTKQSFSVLIVNGPRSGLSDRRGV
jgi:hypothetical protein